MIAPTMISFKSASDQSYTIVLFVVLVLVFSWTCLAVVTNDYELTMLWSSFPLVVFAMYLLVLPERLKYRIKDNRLECWNGAFKRGIDVNRINGLEEKKQWTSFRFLFSSATSGIILRYGRFGRLDVNPENKQEFIEELRRINPDIQIS